MGNFYLFTTLKLRSLLLDLGVEIINLISIVRIFIELGRKIYISFYCFVRENFTASNIEIG